MSTLDRDAARTELYRFEDGAGAEETLDASEGCVRPAPAHTIDRDALLRELMLGGPNSGAIPADFEEHADRVLALLRPVDGVTLTRDEASTAAAVMRLARGASFTGDPRLMQETYRKLEAAS